MDRIWTKNFILLVLASTLIASVNYALSSCIVVYARHISSSGVLIGLVTAAFYFGSVGARFGCGSLVRICGTRRLMLVSALLCAVVCVFHNFAGLILVLIGLRILHGIGYSVFSTAASTASSFIVPQRRMSEGMGYFMLCNVLAMAFGPSMALAIISKGSLAQFQTMFYVMAGLCLVGLLLTLPVSGRRRHVQRKPAGPSGTPAPRSAAQESPERLPQTWFGFEKGVFLPSLISFLMVFAYAPTAVYMSEYGLSRGWTHIGATYSMYAAGLFISRVFSGRISDRRGAIWVIVPSYICGICALVAVGLSPAEIWLFPAMFVLGLGIGCFTPEIMVLCISRCSEARRASALAAYNGSGDLGFIAGCVVSGVVMTRFGFSASLLFSAGLGLLSFLIYLFTLSGDGLTRKPALR